MAFLEPQYLNGRSANESCIRIAAYWLDGWKFKDNKWKFEEEVILPHVGAAYFRCRVHLFGESSHEYTREAVLKQIDAVDCAYDVDGLQVECHKRKLNIVAPLRLRWSKTDNESKNPCLFWTTGQYGLHLEPIGQLTFQFLVTYRNLNQLFRSQRMFVGRSNWV